MTVARHNSENKFERFFLGAEAGFLERCAGMLAARMASDWGPDLSRTLLVAPTVRGAELALEQLARRCDLSFVPCRTAAATRAHQVLTAAHLQLGARPASAWARSCAWRIALQATAEVAKLAGANEATARAGLPAPAEVRRAAALTSALFSADVALEALPLHARQDKAIDRILRALPHYTQELDALGLADLDVSARTLLDRPAAAASSLQRVILCGTLEIAPLLRRQLTALPLEVVALIAWEEAEAERFDELGACRSTCWPRAAELLEAERWQAVATMPQMARAFGAWLGRAREGRCDAPQRALVLLDPQSHSSFQRAAREHGQVCQAQTQLAFAETPAGEWLRALGAWLEQRARDAWARLLRLSDVARAIERSIEAPVGALAAWLDEDHELGLQASSEGLVSPKVVLARRASNDLFSGLCETEPRPASALARALRASAARVFELAPEDDLRARWIWAESLRRLGQALDEIEELQASALDLSLLPSAFVAALAARLELLPLDLEPAARLAIAPPTARVNCPTWKELVLDASDEVFLAGLSALMLPAPIALERELGSEAPSELLEPARASRRARDAFVLELLRRRRVDFVAFSARESAAGDVLRPSPLVFVCEPTEAARRIQRFYHPGDASRDAAVPSGRSWTLPYDPERTRAPAVVQVSALNLFRASPYTFYLRHVLKLSTRDDSSRQLDPSAFGRLAHQVLHEFAQSELAASDDAGAIAAWLRARVEHHAAQRFGRRAWPAVAVQCAQLAWRLERFATPQAELSASGWRIVHSEFVPPALEWQIEGQSVRIEGRIDRVDFHAPTQRYRVWDYKTGRALKSGGYSRAKGRWLDLQLPLYREMLKPLCHDAPIGVGYLALDAGEDSLPLSALDELEPERYEAALESARECLRGMQRPGWFMVAGRAQNVWSFDFLAGRGAVLPPPEPAAAGAERGAEDGAGEPDFEAEEE